MQTQKMFHAMALSWATALSLAVVAVCFAGPETPSTGNTSTGNTSTGNTQAADTSATAASDDTTGGITAGDYKQADELAADQAKATEQSTTSADDAPAVDRAVNQFYMSLNTLFKGDATGMEEVWSHADDVTYMGPVGGYQIGWQQVQAVWEQQAALKLGGKVEPKEIHITIGGQLASVQCLEAGNNVDAEGQSEEVSIRATSLFRKENGEWKMIGHHTDPLTYLENETEEEMSAD